MQGSSFSRNLILLLRGLPAGWVVTYGQLAAMAGNPRAARGVVWFLHSSSAKHDLPWHRVVAKGGRIALSLEGGGRLQRLLLEREGVSFHEDGTVDMEHHHWEGRPGPRRDSGPHS